MTPDLELRPLIGRREKIRAKIIHGIYVKKKRKRSFDANRRKKKCFIPSTEYLLAVGCIKSLRSHQRTTRMI